METKAEYQVSAFVESVEGGEPPPTTGLCYGEFVRYHYCSCRHVLGYVYRDGSQVTLLSAPGVLTAMRGYYEHLHCPACGATPTWHANEAAYREMEKSRAGRRRLLDAKLAIAEEEIRESRERRLGEGGDK